MKRSTPWKSGYSKCSPALQTNNTLCASPLCRYYSELHRRAHHYMARQRAGQILQTTALINEAYLRLLDLREFTWQDRAHFFAVCARVMRQILKSPTVFDWPIGAISDQSYWTMQFPQIVLAQACQLSRRFLV